MPISRCCGEEDIANMKKISARAVRDAKKIAADESKTRSTKTRAVYKTKADALDEIHAILHRKAGPDPKPVPAGRKSH